MRWRLGPLYEVAAMETSKLDSKRPPPGSLPESALTLARPVSDGRSHQTRQPLDASSGRA